MSLGKQVFRGSILSYGSFLISKLLAFVGTLILARVLVPRDFGVVGYAFVVLGFLYVVKSLGMGSALVYRQDLTTDEAGELFVVALISAMLFCGVCWIIAPVAALFFDNSRITLVTRVLGFSFILNALGDVHSAQLQKRMHFGRRFIPSLLFNLTKGVVSIGLALGGFGYWSIVWGQLAGSVTATLASWALYPWVPRLRIRLRSVRWMIQYGTHIAILEFFALLVLNCDNIIVGRILGSAALGLYALSFTIPQMLTINLSGAVSQAVFPAFATVQTDRDALRQGYLSVLRYTSLVLLPIGLGLFAVTPAFVHTFYRPIWWPMIPAAQALALYATLLAIGWSSSDVYMAIGRPDLQWKLDAVQAVLLVPALVLGAHLGGITGVALGQVVMVTPYCLARYWLIHRTIGVPYGGIGAALRAPIIAGVAMCAVCLVVAALTEHHLRSLTVLVLQATVGAVVFAALVLRLDQELRTFLPRRRPRDPVGPTLVTDPRIS